jgi:NADH-quinone oxidoreductase subunit C
MMVDVTAVDLLPVSPRWEVVYQLTSLSRNVRFRLKVEIEDGPDPEVPSITSVYQSANWFEREIFDLMGIRFPGHPALRRILLPDDWQGFPLRYDHPIGGEEVGFTS